MKRDERVKTMSKGNWLLYAMNEFELTENEALVEWYNGNYTNRYLVVEAREDNSTRLFIREVTELIADAFKKQGWWNIFTVTDTPTSKGLYIAKAKGFRLDRNGYVNAKVECIRPIDEIQFQQMFSSKSDGTWNSVAWWYMIGQSRMFFDEYTFNFIGIHNPNVDVLLEKHPELTEDMPEGELKYHYAAVKALDLYLKGELPLSEIEECLNTPTPWEKVVDGVWKSVARGNIEKVYGEKYPLFAKKVTHNVVAEFSSLVNREDVEAYLLRQTELYQKLVDEKAIEPVGDFIEAVEKALEYRKALQDAEKARKKAEKKAKKAAK